MAHEVESMAYAHEVPWHGLGNNVPADSSIEEMLVAAGIDWTVEKRKLFYPDMNGQLKDTGKYGLVRSSDDTFFDVVGHGWNPLNNRDAFEFFRKYVEAGGATLETAGSLKGGRIVWGLANLNHAFTLPGGDKVQNYLCLSNPHQFGKSIQANTTSVRVVCANTFALMNSSQMNQIFRKSHATAFDVEEAQMYLGLVHEQVSEFERNANLLSKLNMSWNEIVGVLAPIYQPGVPDVDDLLVGTVMLNNPMNQIMECISTAPGAVPGTGWGVLNGVTYYADHVAGRSQDTRLTSSWFGVEANRKQEVFSSLLEMAQ